MIKWRFPSLHSSQNHCFRRPLLLPPSRAHHYCITSTTKNKVISSKVLVEKRIVMKIQCDVCGKQEASVFCCADEAALCDSCDRRVHRANKLSGKHRRLPLLHPASDAQAPRCDVCQEKMAFLFCQEDRAILCRDCDAPIHSANELTKKHNRFLLTGIKVSPTATLAGAEVEEEEEKKTKNKKEDHQPADLVQNQSNKSCNSDNNNRVRVVVLEEEEGTVSANSTTTVATDEAAGGGSSSISDYLIKTLPGWRVDDLLLDYPIPSISSPFAIQTSTSGFCKMNVGGEEDFLPFMEKDLDVDRLGGGVDCSIWWVPQVPQVPPQTTISFNRGEGTATTTNAVQQRWRGDDVFTVPQIVVSQPPSSNKRPRSLWCT